MKIDRIGQAKILTPEEIDAIRDDLLNPYDVIFSIGVCTGARIGEIVRLERRDVAPEHITFRKTIAKTRKIRQVPIPPDLAEMLELHLEFLPEITPWLFPNSRGGYLHQDSFSHALNASCQRLDIRGVSTHSMRRTALFNLYQQGVDLKTIQGISGHARLDHLQQCLNGSCLKGD